MQPSVQLFLGFLLFFPLRSPSPTHTSTTSPCFTCVFRISVNTALQTEATECTDGLFYLYPHFGLIGQFSLNLLS